MMKLINYYEKKVIGKTESKNLEVKITRSDIKINVFFYFVKLWSYYGIALSSSSSSLMLVLSSVVVCCPVIIIIDVGIVICGCVLPCHHHYVGIVICGCLCFTKIFCSCKPFFFIFQDIDFLF